MCFPSDPAVLTTKFHQVQQVAVAEPTIAETEDVTQDCDNVATGMSREQLVSEPPIWADKEQDMLFCFLWNTCRDINLESGAHSLLECVGIYL